MRRSIERALVRYSSLLLLDVPTVFLSFGFAFLLRFEGRVPLPYSTCFLQTIGFLIIAHCSVNAAFGLYSRLWQYASAQDVGTIIASGVLTTTAVFAFDVMGGSCLPLSVILMGGIFTTGAFTVVRYRQRLVSGLIARLERAVGSPDRKRVLIVGAGGAGQVLARQIQQHEHGHEYELVGFVDDNPLKQGLRLHGLMVLGSRGDIPRLAHQRRVDLVIIAIHRISGPNFREILSYCQQTEAQVKVLPDVLSLLRQPAEFPSARDVEPRDLLGRRETPVDEDACRRLLSGRVVLVTGACGSIGSELCRQIVRYGPRKLLMVDHNETGLYDVQLEMEATNPSLLEANQIAYIIADVTDWTKMEALIAAEQPQIIFHAAAYKHVPLMEANPEEAVRVNVKGTRMLCQLAQQHGVERFVLISTDKAVRPSSVMGLSKRIGELLILALNSSHGGLYTAVRFGNVLASRGSAVLAFAQQISQGGPVKLTDERMTRYFMTSSEAVGLILQAATLTQGGDIFLLDMGQEIRIVDLAQKMIRLQGLRVGKDVDIVFTGIRPGEKLREELIYEGLEDQEPTVYPGIIRLSSRKSPLLGRYLTRIGRLELMAQSSPGASIRTQMRETVAEFNGPDQTNS